MKLTLGFSPCPNDTFIFDALVNKKIETKGLEFDVVFADIEKLNLWALEGKLDITKLSFNAFTHCTSNYSLLDSGSALGRKCGPLLIKKPETIINKDSKIAIPGRYTTANMLFKMAYPNFQNKAEVLFSEIQDDIIEDKFDAGLIIHENRFTYQSKGLIKVKDLGQFWENETGLPIPLGGIVISRNLSYEIQKKFESVLRKSVKYAFENRESSLDFIKSHSQEMETRVINSHIDLYVNKFSISLGEEGREAVEKVFEKSAKSHKDVFL